MHTKFSIRELTKIIVHVIVRLEEKIAKKTTVCVQLQEQMLDTSSALKYI
jgi:hypothetical protein